MKYFVLTFLSVSILLINATSCGNMSSNNEQISKDTVQFETISVADSNLFKMSDGKDCTIKASIAISYPAKYKDATSTLKLTRLFTNAILDANIDSLEIKKISAQYLRNILDQFGTYNADIDSCMQDNNDSNTDISIFSQYSTDIKVTPIFNQDNIIAFCKEEITKRDGKISMSSHNYYTFDLKTLSQIELNNIFDDEAISEITQLLKNKLIDQLKVENENALYEMGYFNLDNLIANNNFYVSNKGITWGFLPYEIACFSIGETNITLLYSEITQYINDDSILSQYK